MSNVSNPSQPNHLVNPKFYRQHSSVLPNSAYTFIMLAIFVGFGQATTGSGGFSSQTCCSPFADPVVSIGSSPWAPSDPAPDPGPPAGFCWVERDSDFADHCVKVYGAERASRRARRRALFSSIIRRSCSIFPRVAWFSWDRVNDSSVK